MTSISNHPSLLFCESLEQRCLFSLSVLPGLIQSQTNLSTARAGIGAASVNGKALFAGGYTLNPSVRILDAVDIYSPASGLSDIAKLSVARFGMATATLGSKAYFAGGGNGAGKSRAIDIYDADTGKWTTTKLSIPREYASATVNGEQLIIIGGTQKKDASADVFNRHTKKWSTIKLPRPLLVGTAAATAGRTSVFTDGTIADIYDSANHRWFITRLPNAAPDPVATAIGSRVVVVGSNGQTDIYDAVTGRWSSGANVIARMGITATSVGSDAIFAGGRFGDSMGTHKDAIDIYDAKTGNWSHGQLSEGRSGMASSTVGNVALFAGGTDTNENFSTKVDIFTDTAPSPVLSGGLTGTPGHRDQVTVINSGDADLPAGYTIQLYATPDRTLGGAILVGSRTVSSSLAAGASSSPFNIRTLIPKDMPAGSYHLLAAVQDANGHITPIAAEDATFRVHNPHAGSAASHAARSAKVHP